MGRPSLQRHAPVRALRRSPGLSLLMIATLGFGLAVWQTTHAVAFSLGQDPMRGVAGLWRVELVRHGEIREILRGTDMGFVSELAQLVLSPGEVEALSASGIPARAAAVTSAELPVEPPDALPRMAWARFAGRDVFALFGVRLAEGRPFDEGGRELLVSEPDAGRWFGGSARALGRTLRVAGEEWCVVGVVSSGAAAGRRMHLSDGPADPALWMPFRDAVRLGVLSSSRHPVARAGSAPNGDFAFASLWVELRGPGASERFLAWLGRWAEAHPEAGVPRIRRYQDWSGVLGTPPAYRVLELFGALALAACCLTLLRLFHTRSRLHQRDVALRRALGASRPSLLGDALWESAVLVALGVVAGELLAAGALHLLENAVRLPGAPAALPGGRAAFAAAVGAAAGLSAAVLPAWRAAAEPPARALRSLV
jgi:putative ABC transport system permease protein